MATVTLDKCFFSALALGDRFVILPESFRIGSLPTYVKVSPNACVKAESDADPDAHPREKKVAPEQPVLRISTPNLELPRRSSEMANRNPSS